MAPEYGATCGIFPVDDETLRYLRLSGRSEALVSLVEAYYKEQGLFHTADTPEAEYTDVLELDLSTVEPCIAGPKRPQDRVSLSHAAKSFEDALPSLLKPGQHVPPKQEARWEGEGGHPAGIDSPARRRAGHVKLDEALKHGSVVIAAITSCTNTSNPVGTGRRRIAGQEGGRERSHGPVVGEDFTGSWFAGRDRIPHSLRLDALSREAEVPPGGLRLHHLHRELRSATAEVSDVVIEKELVVASVLSGNRNFEGRINSEVRANYLMSPPLVVAYALAGRIDLTCPTSRWATARTASALRST